MITILDPQFSQISSVSSSIFTFSIFSRASSIASLSGAYDSDTIFFQSVLPSSITSSLLSISAVKSTSINLWKLFSKISVTIIPSSVGHRLVPCFSTYSLFSIVAIVGAYVLGLPIPSSSSVFTKLASVYLAGGCVKCWSGNIFSIFNISPFSILGKILSSLSEKLYTLV